MIYNYYLEPVNLTQPPYYTGEGARRRVVYGAKLGNSDYPTQPINLNSQLTIIIHWFLKYNRLKAHSKVPNSQSKTKGANHLYGAWFIRVPQNWPWHFLTPAVPKGKAITPPPSKCRDRLGLLLHTTHLCASITFYCHSHTFLQQKIKNQNFQRRVKVFLAKTYSVSLFLVL